VMRDGIILQSDPEKLSKQFVSAIAQHRFWEREKPRRVPA
jgi:catalase